ncbi:MAG: DUF3857 domain-containing protein [Acidobacteriota bacterium]
MKKIIILIIILTAVFYVYPVNDYNARYLDLEIKYTLKNDGTQVFDYFHRVKLLNSTRGFGESFIKYNPEFQKLDVISSVTTMADGTKVKTPDNGYNEVLPREAKRFAVFSNLKEMVVSHTGIESGAEIELRYRLTTKKGFIPYFTGREFITKNVPVDKYTLKVELPEGDKLNYKVYNYSIKPEVKSSGGSLKYIFRGENISEYRRNFYVKSYERPYIVFSNLEDLNGILPEIRKFEKECMVVNKKMKKIKESDPSVREVLAGLKKELLNPLENCRTGLELSGFTPRKVHNIIRSGYATKFEKVMLAGKLLKKAGIEYSMLLPVPGFSSSDKVFSFLNAGEAVFLVNTQEEQLFLDPVKPGTDLNLSGNSGIVLVDVNSGKVLPLKKTGMENNSIILKGKVKLKDNKFTGNIRIFTSGSFFSYSGFIKNKDTLYKRTMGKIFPVSKAKNVKTLKVTGNSAELTGDIETKPGKWGYEQFFYINNFKIPTITKSMAGRNTTKYPVTTGNPFVVKVSLTMVIPKEYSVDMLKKNKKIDNIAGLYEYSAKEEKKGTINIDLKFGLKKGRTRAEDYPALKELIDNVLGGDFQLILKKKK